MCVFVLAILYYIFIFVCMTKALHRNRLHVEKIHRRLLLSHTFLLHSEFLKYLQHVTRQNPIRPPENTRDNL